mmetsp:Transcript_18976/g.54175  ORF Transcript_18976/g.54175 Transcript_18976/m.54175 type:complete len:221 (+) Transcript_18976:75-737(+)
MPFMAMAMPWPRAQASTASSWTEPPAWTTYLTPNLAATSMLSGKGKNASEASDTPVNWPSNSARLEDVSSGGHVPEANSLSKAAFSWGAYESKPPSRYWTRAFTFCCLLSPATKGNANTSSDCLSHHVATFLPASLTQSTRDCWPAPTPTTWPPRAKQMEFDCVYFAVIAAKTRSRCASGGMGPFFTSSVFTSSNVISRSFRFCAKPTPYTSRYSRVGGV